MQLPKIAFGICLFIASVYGGTVDFEDYPRTERILYKKSKDTSCLTKTVFSALARDSAQKDEVISFRDKLQVYCQTTTRDTDIFNEIVVKCLNSKDDCQKLKALADPDNYLDHLKSVGDDADKVTLQDYAAAMPINNHVDLTSQNVSVCKDPYGRFYGIHRFFNNTCPLIAYTDKDGVVIKLSPTSPREIRWLIREFQWASNKEHIQYAVDPSNYKDICIFVPDKIVYVCGFSPFLKDDIMPAYELKSLCPGTKATDYMYTVNENSTTGGSFNLSISDAHFTTTCNARVTITVKQLAKDDTTVKMAVFFNGQSPPNDAPNWTNFQSVLKNAIRNRDFKRINNTNELVFQKTMAITAQTLELSMSDMFSLLQSETFSSCYHMVSKTCQFVYNPYCDSQLDYFDVSRRELLTKFGDFECRRRVFDTGCADTEDELMVKIVCRCKEYMCDDPRRYSTLVALGEISSALSANHNCFTSENAKPVVTSSRFSAYCYMTLTQPNQDKNIHQSEFGVLDMKNYKHIVENVRHCGTLQELEADLFALTPRSTRSCRVVKGSNSTMYQCCCEARTTPCNTERVLQKFFNMQVNMNLHSCQFHSHPTGACAASRFSQFRCIGIFKVTRNNGFKSKDEDCVSSHLDNDRAHTLCRQYGSSINPHGGTCGMMAMYDMRKGQEFNETDIPIYVCCGDSYRAFEKKMRTRKLKRIGTF
uniref:Glycoprotein n=1 Tax=Panagrellus redivivus TaxID=6233 RepID=A0A7E4V6C9_PANRE